MTVSTDVSRAQWSKDVLWLRVPFYVIVTAIIIKFAAILLKFAAIITLYLQQLNLYICCKFSFNSHQFNIFLSVLKCIAGEYRANRLISYKGSSRSRKNIQKDDGSELCGIPFTALVSLKLAKRVSLCTSNIHTCIVQINQR